MATAPTATANAVIQLALMASALLVGAALADAEAPALAAEAPALAAETPEPDALELASEPELAPEADAPEMAVAVGPAVGALLSPVRAPPT
jgi:hypothetical protein